MSISTLDARDYRGTWREARMVKIERGKVRVDYIGSKGGGWMDVDGKDIAPKGSYVERVDNKKKEAGKVR